MGTRNLTCVVRNGSFKVAQYGQWDGYPSAAGVGILEFLRTADIDKFRRQLDNVRWLTEEEEQKMDRVVEFYMKEFPGVHSPVADIFPLCSRDTGFEVLNILHQKLYDFPTSYRTVGLQDQHAFAGDSLFCEWAYVLDLDKKVLEVYKGFNTDPNANQGRFSNMGDLERRDAPGTDADHTYYPVELIRTYKFDDLPTDEQLIADCEPTEDEEDGD